jgi:hypothetical protein
MVGTGRFELPNGSALPRTLAGWIRAFAEGECLGWGASWVGREELRLAGFGGEAEMVGPGKRF